MELKHIDSPVEKKVLGTVVNQEGDANNGLGHERTHH